MPLRIWEVQGNKNGKINQGMSGEEIRKAISSTPNFKACGPNGIPMEFFKALITW
jgi:hypothetical protein